MQPWPALLSTSNNEDVSRPLEKLRHERGGKPANGKGNRDEEHPHRRQHKREHFPIDAMASAFGSALRRALARSPAQHAHALEQRRPIARPWRPRYRNAHLPTPRDVATIRFQARGKRGVPTKNEPRLRCIFSKTCFVAPTGIAQIILAFRILRARCGACLGSPAIRAQI